MAHGKRIDWIDAGKGIGIILVTFGHIANGDGKSVWLPALDLPIDAVYLFHMPLFFFLGGFTFSSRKPFGKFIKNKARTLLIPYYVFSLYFLAKPLAVLMLPQLSNTLQSNHDYGNIGRQFYNILVNGEGLWFLWAYFIGELLVYGISKITENRIVYGFLGVALIAISYLIPRLGLIPVTLPFKVIQGIGVAGWILLGILTQNLFLMCRMRVAAFGFVITAALYVACAFPAVTGPSSVSAIAWGKCGMVLGVLAGVFLAILVQRSKVIDHIGRSSISFYVVNAITLNVGKIFFFRILGLDLTHANIMLQWFAGIVLTVFCLALLWIEDWLIRRFIPWSIGLKISKNVDMQPAEM